MRTLTLIPALAVVGCATPGFDAASCKDVEGACVQVSVDDPTALLELANTVEDGTTIVLGEGTFELDNQVTLRAEGLTLRGQGIDVTTLDFAATAAQTNGVSVVGDDFLIEDLTVVDAKKDGIRIEDSDGITIRRVKVTWSGGPKTTNGAYGIYPVRVSHVLLEDSEAYNASDAGIYVGQCRHAIVRNNIAKQNVAGLEIENTQYADVYGNLVEDNTGGLVVFDLPGNPVIGRDIHIHDNEILANNRPNFAPGGTVAQVLAGTGTFAMASRRVEIEGNTYRDNDSLDVAVISGLAIEGDPMQWALSEGELVGEWDDLTLDADSGMVFNFRTTDVYVHDNTHEGGGTNPDDADLDNRPLGFLIGQVYGDTAVDNILYDAIGESAFSATEASGNSNDHHVCAHDGTFASLDLETLVSRFEAFDFPSIDDLYRPSEEPYAPFDCTGFSGGDLVGPDMDVGE